MTATKLARVATRSMRIVALPLTAPCRPGVGGRPAAEHLTYYHFLTPPDTRGANSWHKWAIAKASDLWAGLGKAPEGSWKVRTRRARCLWQRRVRSQYSDILPFGRGERFCMVNALSTALSSRSSRSSPSTRRSGPSSPTSSHTNQNPSPLTHPWSVILSFPVCTCQFVDASAPYRVLAPCAPLDPPRLPALGVRVAAPASTRAPR